MELVSQALPLLFVCLVQLNFDYVVSRLPPNLGASNYLRVVLIVVFVMCVDLFLTRHTARTHGAASKLLGSVTSALNLNTPGGDLMTDLVIPNLTRLTSYALAACTLVTVVSPSSSSSHANTSWLWDGMSSAALDALNLLAPLLPFTAQRQKVLADAVTFMFCVGGAGALVFSGSRHAPTLIAWYSRLVGFILLGMKTPSSWLHALLIVTVFLPSVMQVYNMVIKRFLPASVTKAGDSLIKALSKRVIAPSTTALEWAAATYFTASLAHTLTMPILTALHINPSTIYNFRVWVLSTHQFFAENLSLVLKPFTVLPQLSAVGMFDLLDFLVRNSIPAAVCLAIFVFALHFVSQLPEVGGIFKAPQSKGPSLWSSPLSTLTNEVAWVMLVSSALALTLFTTPVKGTHSCAALTPAQDGYALLVRLATKSKCAAPTLLELATTAPTSWNPLAAALDASATGVTLSTLLHAVFLLSAALCTLPLVLSGKGKVLESGAWASSTHFSKGVLLALALATAALSPAGADAASSLQSLLPWSQLDNTVTVAVTVAKACTSNSAALLLALWAHKESPEAPLWTAIALPLALGVEGFRRGLDFTAFVTFLRGPATLDVVLVLLAASALSYAIKFVAKQAAAAKVQGGAKKAKKN